MPRYFDPKEPWAPASRRKPRARQSTFSVAMEALGGGLVIALFVYGVAWLLGF